MAKKPAPKPGAASSRLKSTLSPAALRALEEAGQRRKARKGETARSETEVGGPNRPDPVRYGDWEKEGIISDF